MLFLLLIDWIQVSVTKCYTTMAEDLETAQLNKVEYTTLLRSYRLVDP